MSKVLHLFMPEQGEQGVIQLWLATRKGQRVKWVEARGRPYSQWDVNEDTPMSRLHGCMEGWHTTVCHQDAILDLHDRHPDYNAVAEFMEEEILGELGL